uniref:Uncharacterized protein n=1 Tax=Lotus japonicus TaxID=34305 RepID=I3SRK2_LOTJA|nr:unknown [Lotus japonicus]
MLMKRKSSNQPAKRAKKKKRRLVFAADRHWVRVRTTPPFFDHNQPSIYLESTIHTPFLFSSSSSSFQAESGMDELEFKDERIGKSENVLCYVLCVMISE